MTLSLPERISDLCNAFASELKAVLDQKLYALYVYGASVFPETQVTGDVDFHVILVEALTESEKKAINNLHKKMAADYPPLGAELDAYYLLLDQAKQPALPTHQLDTSIVDHAWALHRAHMLAGKCVVLHGPEPGSLFPVPSASELEEALEDELSYIERHLNNYPGYCILNLCRLMYSCQTGDVVVSKAAAGAWAATKYPQWSQLVARANQLYLASSAAKTRDITGAVLAKFLDFSRQQMASATGFIILRSLKKDRQDDDKKTD